MRSYPIDPASLPFPTSRVREIDFSDQPVIALLYAISGVLIEIFGSMFLGGADRPVRAGRAIPETEMEHTLVHRGQCRSSSAGCQFATRYLNSQGRPACRTRFSS